MPSGRGGRGGGMGNPNEEPYFYDQFRDYGPGDPRAKDVIYDPLCDPNKVNPARKRDLDEFFCRMTEEFKKMVVYTKRPAFVESPFFAKPKIVHNTITLAPASGPVLLLSYKVQDRNRLVVTTVGIDVDPPVLLDDQQLLFWFAINGQVIPYFNDQSAAAAALAGFQDGKTTVIPGSTEHPFNLRENGIPWEVRGQGERDFQVFGQNFNGLLSARLEPQITLYEYWMPNSSAFEAGDNQI